VLPHSRIYSLFHALTASFSPRPKTEVAKRRDVLYAHHLDNRAQHITVHQSGRVIRGERREQDRTRQTGHCTGSAVWRVSPYVFVYSPYDTREESCAEGATVASEEAPPASSALAIYVLARCAETSPVGLILNDHTRHQYFGRVEYDLIDKGSNDTTIDSLCCVFYSWLCCRISLSE